MLRAKQKGSREWSGLTKDLGLEASEGTQRLGSWTFGALCSLNLLSVAQPLAERRVNRLVLARTVTGLYKIRNFRTHLLRKAYTAGSARRKPVGESGPSSPTLFQQSPPCSWHLGTSQPGTCFHLRTRASKDTQTSLASFPSERSCRIALQTPAGPATSCPRRLPPPIPAELFSVGMLATSGGAKRNAHL